MSNRDVAIALTNWRVGASKNMVTDGTTVWSYQLPIVTRKGGVYQVRKRGTTKTTSMHIGVVVRELKSKGHDVVLLDEVTIEKKE